MRACKNCGAIIPNRTVVAGKEFTLHRRHYCLACNPIGERAFRGGRKVAPHTPGYKVKRKVFRCPTCQRVCEQRTRNSTCSTCQNQKLRAANKLRAIQLLGGKCSFCGYDGCTRAMVFHHKDPAEKRFTLAYHWNAAWEKIKKELAKCVLLCNRCHAELHDVELSPARTRRSRGRSPIGSRQGT